jgi:hypothetical protein
MTMQNDFMANAGIETTTFALLARPTELVGR